MTGESTQKQEDPLLPNSPRQQRMVAQFREVLDEVLDHDGVFVNIDELALDLWRITRGH